MGSAAEASGDDAGNLWAVVARRAVGRPSGLGPGGVRGLRPQGEKARPDPVRGPGRERLGSRHRSVGFAGRRGALHLRGIDPAHDADG